ncbi:MAG: isoaspartyl peptidase/L-asparaginase family protein [Bacteroidia bacterium]
MKTPSLAIHGGAGTISPRSMTPQKEKAYKDALQFALETAYMILNDGGSAMDAVEKVVNALEDTPLFNAGTGAVFTAGGTHEMDAAIMNGANLDAGAVAGIRRVKNPISVARLVYQHTPHVMLAGPGAEEFANRHGAKLASDHELFDAYRYQQWLRVKGKPTVALDHTEDMDEDKKFGTVGAVACDQHGNIAAATSTGGMTNKRYGRIGDSPLIGVGTYADNATCAVSCTGHGEPFIKAVAAYDIAARMRYGGLSLAEAAHETVHGRLIELQAEGGIIAVDAHGNIAMPFNAQGMYRAWRKGEDWGTAIY